MADRSSTLAEMRQNSSWSSGLIWIPVFGIVFFLLFLQPLMDAVKEQQNSNALASSLRYLSATNGFGTEGAQRLLIASYRIRPQLEALQDPLAEQYLTRLDRLEASLFAGAYQSELQHAASLALRALQNAQLRRTQVALDNMQTLSMRTGLALLFGFVFLSISAGFNYRRRLKQQDAAEPALGKEQLGEMLFDHSPEPVCIVDHQGLIIAANPAYCRESGYPEAGLIGKPMDFVRSGQQDAEYLEQINQVVTEEGCWSGELWQRRQTGEAYPETVTIVRLMDKNKEFLGNMYISMNVRAARESNKLMVWRSNHDNLTKLPNRTLFQERLGRMILESRELGVNAAIFSIDLDRFTLVNDSIGHGLGDRLLIEAAYRFAMCVRESDTVARLSNDEFALMIVGVSDYSEAERIGRQVIEEIQKPFYLDEQEVFVTASIGVSMLPQDGDESGTLMQRADTAMAQAKESGGNAVVFYQPVMNQRAARRLEVETHLRRAVKENQLQIYYQPVVDQRDRKVVGAEALLRWNHPEWGMVSPGEFIPVAEETGSIVEIGAWVIEQVAAQLLVWQKTGLDHLRVSLNLSGRQLKDPSDLAALLKLMESSPITQMTLEITESVLMDNTEAVLEFLQRVQGEGAKIALDDFGTGYSSLSYLRQYHFDVLKIDKSFVDDLEHSNTDLGLVASIVSMGRILGVEIVAEGVESMTQLQYLKQIGCDLIQGYYFARPMPIADFEAFLAENRMEFVEEHRAHSQGQF